MELTILTVPGCPNSAALEERLAAVLADYPGAWSVRRRQVAEEREAAEAGMAGWAVQSGCGYRVRAAAGTLDL
jgi:hypothetical protein